VTISASFAASPAMAGKTEIIAQGKTAIIVARPSSTTIQHPDGSKEVVYPNGRHEFYNFDGSPRGINRTVGIYEGNMTTTYWGPNSYGPAQ
jgi:hypothetical protein